MTHVVYAVSEGQKFDGTLELQVVSCATCHITYAIPGSLYRSALKYPGSRPNGWKVVCPLGHEWWYIGLTVEEKLQRAENRLAAERASHDQTAASLRATRGAAKRARNERDRLKAHATAGVCPVDGCHRHFTNLERHIASKHPDYAETALPE